jgi:site-specific DNA-methyltransferase (adenine-specific)
MSQADLAALPVDSLAPSNALLFMWATWPNLWEALDLGHRWGFAFKTCAFNWVKLTSTGKPATGMGSYTRANSEPCLLFTRGKAAPLILDHGVNQIVTTCCEEALPTEDVLTVPGRHSAKPPEVRDRIIRLVGEKVATIELFARDPDPRFERWGDQGNETISLRAS